jgi:hypothetical protein
MILSKLMFHTIGRSACPKQKLHKGLIPIGLAFDNGTSWFVGGRLSLSVFQTQILINPPFPNVSSIKPIGIKG